MLDRDRRWRVALSRKRGGRKGATRGAKIIYKYNGKPEMPLTNETCTYYISL